MSASGGDRPGRVLLEDANGLTPVDRLPGAGAPDNYGCDGPPHAMTLKYFPVLREDGDSVEFKAPEGITFLGGAVLAREAFGHKIWLISAADQADCSKPVVCIVTDFGSDAVACSPVEPDKSTPLVTRIEPGGDPTLLFFAAAPNGVDRVDLVPSGAKSEPVSLDVENGILAGAATLPEAEARALAEAAGGTQWKADPRVTADHDDR